MKFYLYFSERNHLHFKNIYETIPFACCHGYNSISKISE